MGGREDDGVLLARVWSWTADKLERDARRDIVVRASRGLPPQPPSVSVFGLAAVSGETDDEHRARVRAVINENLRNIKYCSFVRAGELRRHEFDVALDEPPPNHYGVHVDPDDRDALTRLEFLFTAAGKERL